MDTIQTRIHHQRCDSDTNSMPERNLKNLPAWNKSDAPALEVTMEQPEKVYLRGQVYDTYTGTGWKTADTKDAALIYRMANGKLLKFPVEKEKQSEQTTD